MSKKQTIQEKAKDIAGEIGRGEFLVNQFGEPRAYSLISTPDKLRHELVTSISDRFTELHDLMISIKEFAFSECDAHVSLIAAEYDIKIGGNIGNVEFIDYPQLNKVQIQVNRVIKFTEGLNIAADAFNDWSNKQLDKSNGYTQAMFNASFKTDNHGNISTARLLDLVRMECDDPEWIIIKNMILDSMMTVSGCRYIRYYTRINVTDKWTHVTLEFAKI